MTYIFKVLTLRKNSNTIETSTVQINLKDNGIAVFRAKDHMTRVFTLDDLKEIDEKIMDFVGTHRLYLIHIVNGKYTQEARRHLQGHTNVADKIAMVAKGPFQKLVGNFFLGFNRPNITIKLFTTADEAEKWLLDPLS